MKKSPLFYLVPFLLLAQLGSFLLLPPPPEPMCQVPVPQQSQVEMADLWSAQMSQAPSPSESDAGALHRVAHIRFDSPVTFSSALGFDQMMTAALRTRPEVIVVEFRTPGGSMEAGFSMTKTIEDVPVPTVCVADGLVASEGVFLLQACDIRLMTTRSTLMVHEPFVEGKIDKDVRLLIDQQQKITYAWTEFAAKKWKITPAELRKVLRRTDLWLTEKEAREMGAVDGVIPAVIPFIAGLIEDLRLPGDLKFP